ncbi:hypothetical protein [Nocardia sp. NPDC058705]|uniref:hypothetical protein n=1 Tax=Nocardia sp. NPDC058705 TaxID=3346609 RepID=UPI0036C398EC
MTKWAARKESVTLPEFFAGLMHSMLEHATPQQRAMFERLRAPVAALGTVAADTDPPIWTADATSIAHDLVRKDLMLDRRTASTTLLGVVVGVGLLEPLERWLARATGVEARPVAGGGMYDIDQIEHAAHLFREWDDTFGGGLRRKAVVGQLDEVNDLIGNTGSAAVRQRLLRVLSLLSETAATMSWDSGEQHTAQGYYMLALRSGREAGEPALCANAIAGMARQMLTLDTIGSVTERAAYRQARAMDSLELVRVAQDHFAGDVTPSMHALLRMREAWSYAVLGRASAFRRAAERAHTEFSKVDRDQEPSWLGYFDSAEIDGTIGGRLLELARHQSDCAGEAAETIDRAIAARRPNMWRSSSLDRLGSAEARLIQGEHEEAYRISALALESVAQTNSHRVRAKVSELYTRAGECGDSPAAAGLRELLGPLVASPA